MCETKIILRDIDSIRSFVRQVIQVDFEVDLLQGRYLIDAKSIVGYLPLDTLSPITVVAHTENADEFFEKIEKFTVK